MKIGIITLPLNSNYGGILQAWALRHFLISEGHDVEIITRTDIQFYHSLWVMPIIWCARILKKISGNKNVEIFAEKINNSNLAIKEQHIRSFISNKIKPRAVSKINKIQKNDYDVLIIGSDQIWRRKYVKSLWRGSNLFDVFLEFTKKWKINRIAYAASFGIEKWQFRDSENQRIKRSLNKFSLISLRELDGIELLKKNIGLNSSYVVDPTLLISSNDYVSLINTNRVKKCKELTAYILDESNNKLDIINKFALINGYNIKYLNLKQEHKQSEFISIEEWLSGFKDASFIITDSYHGCLFSLIFNKPFLCFLNKDRGNSRFDTIKSVFNITKNFNTEEIFFKDPELYYAISQPTTTLIDKAISNSKFLLLNSLINQ